MSHLLVTAPRDQKPHYDVAHSLISSKVLHGRSYSYIEALQHGQHRHCKLTVKPVHRLATATAVMHMRRG
jgi:hypothetical protein